MSNSPRLTEGAINNVDDAQIDVAYSRGRLLLQTGRRLLLIITVRHLTSFDGTFFYNGVKHVFQPDVGNYL